MYFTKDLNKNNQNYFKVGVFRVENEFEEQIGEYQRNPYTRQATFFSFQQNGKDFALYSPHYTQIRIMELPTCKDIGGDESQPQDFCSVDFYVPSYTEQEITSRTINSKGEVKKEIWTKRINEPKEDELNEYVKTSSYENTVTKEKEESEIIHRPLTSRLYYPFGFVHGCYWMGDYTVHYLDLSEVENGILKRDERFGYVEIPNNLSLKEAINMENYKVYPDNRENYIQMHVMQTFDLITGKIIEPYE